MQYRSILDCGIIECYSIGVLICPRQNVRRFAEDIIKCIFFNENFRISLNFVSKGPINNKWSLIQVMAWHRTGNKSLSTPVDPVHWRIHAALGEDELSLHAMKDAY